MEVSLLSHLTNSALVVYALQYLKGTEWYKKFAANLPIADRHVHQIMSAVGAFASSLGMHWAVAGNSDAGWVITIAVPAFWQLLHAGWDWVQQLALNQVIFALAVQQKAAAPVVTVPIGSAPQVTVTTPLADVTATGAKI